MLIYGPNITITSGTILTTNISASNIMITKLPGGKALCNKRRGGPRSKIFCEVFTDVPHEVHHGRGKKNWHTWVDKDYLLE